MPNEVLDEGTIPQLDWRKYYGIARRRRWHLALSLFLGWAVVSGISWFLPSVYRSSTLILVEQPTVSKELVPSNVSSGIQDRLDSITQQVLSRTRLLRIIEKLNLYPADRVKASPDELVERMRKNIQVELVRSPEREHLTAFNIYFSHHDPHMAQQVTGELTNILISENLEVRQEQSESTTNFLESQLEEARKTLAAQEQRVREFKDRHLGELPGQLQSNLQILSGLQGQLQAEQDALGRAKQQNAYLESLLAQYRAATATASASPALETELEHLRAELADLSSRYTMQHPDVRKVEEQIARTEKMQQAGTGTTAASLRPRPLPPLMEGESQLKANELEIANRQHAIGSLEKRISDYQSRLNRTPVREQQLADISRDYEQSSINYESLLSKKNQSVLSSNLEKRQQGEHFRMIDPPSLPVKPYSPDRVRLSCLGLVVGMLLAGGVTAAAETLDDRIHDESNFKRLIPAEVLIEVPPLPTAAELSRGRRRLWLEWAGASALSASIFLGVGASFLRS